MIKFPCFYHPATVVFIDDHKSFLSALKQRLPSNLLALAFNDPIKGLEYIKNNVENSAAIKYLENTRINEFQEHDFNSPKESIYRLDWNKLSNILVNKNRFFINTVLVVDQMMPDLDGLQLCEKLNNNPIKKIMLTSNSDHEVAVNAFNRGLIDYFLLKDSPELVQQLTYKISELQNEYFMSLCKSYLGDNISNNKEKLISLYEKVYAETNSIEYYLLDSRGSMLFVDSNGNMTTLAIMSTDDMQIYAGIAEDQDECEIASKLANKNSLIFFPTDLDYTKPAKEWSNMLHPALKLAGSDNIYYSIIKERKNESDQLKGITPYRDILSSAKTF